jgi:hypothetical protein
MVFRWPAMLVVSKCQETVIKRHLANYMIKALSESCFSYNNLELS